MFQMFKYWTYSVALPPGGESGKLCEAVTKEGHTVIQKTKSFQFDTNNRFTLPICINNNEKIIALIDTGSMSCIIDTELVPHHKIDKTTAVFKSASGHFINILGQTEIKFKLGSDNFLINAYVRKTDIKIKNIILGVDFLKKYKVNLDYNKGDMPYIVVDDKDTKQATRTSAPTCMTTQQHKKHKQSKSKIHKNKNKNTQIINNKNKIINTHATQLDEHIKVPLDLDIRLKSGEKILVHNDLLNNLTINQLSFTQSENLLKRKKISVTPIQHKDRLLFKLHNESRDTQTIFSKTIIGIIKIQNIQLVYYISKLTPEEISLAPHQIGTHLNKKEIFSLKQLISKYADVFATTQQHVGITNIYEHKIELKDTTPVYTQPYRSSYAQMEIITKQIDELLAANLVRPSRSRYASPIVLVKKNDGTYRCCFDFRKLNSKILSRPYPMPTVDLILRYLKGGKYFSSLDLWQAFLQIPLRECDKHLTAFVTPCGRHLEFNVVPFGIISGSFAMQEVVDIVFHDVKFKQVLLYVDDIITSTQDFAQHLNNLELIFKRLQDANLRLNYQSVYLLLINLIY